MGKGFPREEEFGLPFPIRKDAVLMPSTNLGAS
jgi:hypothetical protein